MTKKKARSAFGNYKNIKMIIENMHGIDFMTAREIRRREWDSMQVEASKEVALKAKQRDAKRKGSTILEPTGTCSMEFFPGVISVDTNKMIVIRETTRKGTQAGMITHSWQPLLNTKSTGYWTAVLAVI